MEFVCKAKRLEFEQKNLNLVVIRTRNFNVLKTLNSGIASIFTDLTHFFSITK
jgi:hypothetical protein